MIDVMLLPHPSEQGISWGWFGYTADNAAEILDKVDHELKELLMKVMKQCLEDHKESTCYRKDKYNNCDEELELLEPAKTLHYRTCRCPDEQVDEDTSKPHNCPLCNTPSEPYEDEARYGHRWGPENIRLVGIWREAVDGSIGKWDCNMIVELSYTYGHKYHEWGATYGVNAITHHISLYSD